MRRQARRTRPHRGSSFVIPGGGPKISTNGAATSTSVARPWQARLNRLSSTVLPVAGGVQLQGGGLLARLPGVVGIRKDVGVEEPTHG